MMKKIFKITKVKRDQKLESEKLENENGEANIKPSHILIPNCKP